PLAFVRWRNGSFVRTLMPGNAFALAGALGQAGDEVKAKGDLHLTIDPNLHRTLQDAVRAWVKEPAQGALGFDPERPDAKDASLTLIDTFTGELLAMPSAPAVD